MKSVCVLSEVVTCVVKIGFQAGSVFDESVVCKLSCFFMGVLLVDLLLVPVLELRVSAEFTSKKFVHI